MLRMALTLRRVSSGLLAVAVWVLASFLCHLCAKRYFASMTSLPGNVGHGGIEGRQFALAVFLTICQTLACFFTFRITFKDAAKQITEKNFNARALHLALITHLAATFSTNYGLALMNASSVLSIKLMEPVMTAFLVWCVTGERVSVAAWFSLVLLVTGTMGFISTKTGSSPEGVAVGALLGLISNVLYGLRNVTLKHFLPAKQIEFRETASSLHSLQFVTGVTVYLYTTRWNESELLPQLLPLDYAILSAAFHVSYSYVSTFVMLHYLSVVSHAVANIMKRVAVVLAMMLVGQREHNVARFLWLVVSSLGLILYAQNKVAISAREVRQKKEPSAEDTEVGRKSHQLKIVKYFSASLLLLLFVSCVTATSDLRLADRGLLREPDSVHRHIGRRLQGPPPTPEEAPRAAAASSWFHSYASDARQTHVRLFREIIGNRSKVVLLNMLPHTNAKDEALTSLGLLRILDEMNVKASRYCSDGIAGSCVGSEGDVPAPDTSIIVQLGLSSTKDIRDMEMTVSDTVRQFHDHDVTFVLSGGGWEDNVTNRIFSDLASRMRRVSVLVNSPHMYETLSKFRSITLNLAPHLGLSIGPRKRFATPLYDVIWSPDPSHDNTAETCGQLPSNWRCDVRSVDRSWAIPKGHDLLDKSYTTVYLSLLYFVRGRTAVVQGVHGHVMCSLLEIPHVILSSKPDVTSYVKHWLGADNASDHIVLGKDSHEAAKMVKGLLEANVEVIPELSSMIRNIKKFWM